MIKETGSRGILKRGNSIQIIYGPYVTVLKSELEDYLRTRRAKKEIKQLLKKIHIPKIKCNRKVSPVRSKDV